MKWLMAWCVPEAAFSLGWRLQIAVWYEKAWINVEPKERLRYMAIYGVSYP